MRAVLFFLGVWLLIQPVRAQVSPDRVSPDRVSPDRVWTDRIRNVRVRVDSARLEIRYDLLTAQPGDSAYFTVRSRQRGALSINPNYVRGDVGTQITAGTDRRISWDVLGNGYPLNEEIRVTVIIKSGGSSTNVSPSPAQRPVAATTPPRAVTAQAPTTIPVATMPPERPGVTPPTPRRTESVAVAADTARSRPNPTAVQPSKPADQPVATTQLNRPTPAPLPSAPANEPSLSRPTRYAGPAWALLSVVAPGMGNIFVQTPRPQIGLRPFVLVGCYSLLAYGLLERRQSQSDYVTYTEQKNAAAAEPYYKTANEHYHRYYLATRTAAVVAAADVLLTFMRGLRNNRDARRAATAVVRPGLQAGQPTVVLRYAF